MARSTNTPTTTKGTTLGAEEADEEANTTPPVTRTETAESGESPRRSTRFIGTIKCPFSMLSRRSIAAPRSSSRHARNALASSAAIANRSLGSFFKQVIATHSRDADRSWFGANITKPTGLHVHVAIEQRHRAGLSKHSTATQHLHEHDTQGVDVCTGRDRPSLSARARRTVASQTVTVQPDLRKDLVANPLLPFVRPLDDNTGAQQIAAGLGLTDEELERMCYFVEGVIDTTVGPNADAFVPSPCNPL
ncbi:MAG: hypothetical protein ACJATT_005617 [Myxococcota bacterium]|jgi:hypothetical protein